MSNEGVHVKSIKMNIILTVLGADNSSTILTSRLQWPNDHSFLHLCPN